MGSKLRMTAKLLLGGWILLLCSCAPKVVTTVTKSYQSISNPNTIKIIDEGGAVPTGAESLGTVKVGDSGFTLDCDKEKVMNLARIEASKMGGNLLKVTKLSSPDLLSSCYRLRAEVFFANALKDSSSVTQAVQSETSSVESKVVLQPVVNTQQKTLPTNRFAVNTGYSYRDAALSSEIPDFLKDYTKKLMSGMHFDADYTYYYNDMFGVGLKYSRSWYSNSMDVSMTSPDGTYMGITTMEDNIAINFVGPFYAFRLSPSRSKNIFYANAGLGYLGLVNNAVLGSDLKITGGTAGILLEAGYDFVLSENFGLGVKLSIISGTINKMNYKYNGSSTSVDLNQKQKENLERIDLSVGLRLFK